MKRQIAAAAMTLALLGGGIAAAAPANAAPASKGAIAAVDKELKSNKEKLRILKLRLSTDKTVGNASDKKARAYLLASKKDLKAGQDAQCSVAGVRMVLDEVTTGKYTLVQKNRRDSIRADSKKLQNDASRYRAFAQDKRKLSEASEKAGIVFKHQRLGQSYSYYDSSLECDKKSLKQAKTTFAKYNKSLTVKERDAINKRINRFIVHSKIIEAGQRAKDADVKKRIVTADNYVKKEIQKAEKRIKSIETEKKNLLAQK